MREILTTSWKLDLLTSTADATDKKKNNMREPITLHLKIIAFSENLCGKVSERKLDFTEESLSEK